MIMGAYAAKANAYSVQGFCYDNFAPYKHRLVSSSSSSLSALHAEKETQEIARMIALT